MASNEIRIESPDGDGIKREYSALVARANTIIVTDVETHAVAKEGMKELKGATKKIHERLDPIVSTANGLHKSLTRLLADVLAPIDAAYRVLDGRAQDYESAERAKAEAKGRELQEQARKAEEERQLMDAIAAEESGDRKQAEAILAETPSVPVVTVTPALAKVSGESSRTNWKAEVFDKAALIKYVAAHAEWIGLLDANGPGLTALARSQRAALAIPGVRAVTEQVRSFRS